MKFHVHVAGDPSVGLFSFIAVADFQDGIIWDADMIADMKQNLADFYDTPLSTVLTNDEYIKEQAAVLEAEKIYSQSDL